MLVRLKNNGTRQVPKALYLLLLLAGNPVFLFSYQAAPNRREFHFSTTPNSVLTLSNGSGAINVHGVSGRQAVIVASLHSKKVEVEGSQNGNRISLLTHELQNQDGPEQQVDYDIAVPSDLSVSLHAQGGTIRVSNLNGNVEVESETAQITLHDLQNTHANIRSISGPVSISNARQVTVDVTCSSGDVDLKTVTGPVVSVSTSSGPIRYSGLLNDAGEYSFITHSGDITLSLPAEASVDLMARSVRGTVENDFPFQQKSHLNFTPIQGRSFSGTSNSAASSVQLQTFSGRIRLKKQ